MAQIDTIEAYLIESDETLTLIEVQNRLQLPDQLLEEMIEHGLIDVEEDKITTDAFIRLIQACRLHRDLEINLPGVALALELLDELEQLRQEIALLKQHNTF